MRLVCFGDIHMAFRAIERVGPALRTADLESAGRRQIEPLRHTGPCVRAASITQRQGAGTTR